MTTRAQRALVVAAAAAAMAVGTSLVGWQAVPATAAAVSFVRVPAGRPRVAPWLLALAGAGAWGGALVWSALAGGRPWAVAALVGGVLGRPAWLVLLLTLAVPALLAWTAAALADGLAARFLDGAAARDSQSPVAVTLPAPRANDLFDAPGRAESPATP